MKVYDPKFNKQAEQEYNSMYMLTHENVLQVYQIGALKMNQD